MTLPTKRMSVLRKLTSYRKIIYILPALGLLSLPSCVVDKTDSIIGDCTGRECDFKVTMTVPETSVPNTRSLTRSATLETALESLDVLVFDKDSTLVYTTHGRAIDIEKKAGKTYANATIRFKLINEEFFFVFLGNVQSQLNQHIDAKNIKKRLDDGIGTGYREIIELLSFDCPQAKPTRAFPMWGHTQEYFNIENASKTNSAELFKDKPIYMLRSIAKVDVRYVPKMATDTLPNNSLAGKDYAGYFELTSVHIVNVPVNGLVIPRLENIETQADRVMALEPSLHKDFSISNPGYTTISSSDVDPYAGKDKHDQDIMAIVDQLYITENSTIDRSLDEKTCIIIGGKYNKDGSGLFTDIEESFYRVDFIDDRAYYLPIKRNFKYLLTIGVVDEAGAPTIDQAIDGPSLNIETEILNWDDLDMEEVYYDGYYRYYVSPRRSYHTAPEAFDVLATTIVTDSRYTDIQVRFPVDTLGNEIIPSNNFIKTATPYEPKIANKTITNGTTTAELLISLDEFTGYNNDPSSRMVMLEIVFYDHAGNLKVVVPVEIHQETRTRDYEVEDYFVLPIISSIYPNAVQASTTAPDSVWIFAKGTFNYAYFKIQMSGSQFLGEWTRDIYQGTIISGYNQYEEETGNSQYSDYSSVKAPNPQLGTGGWAFDKIDNDNYPITAQSPEVTYNYFMRLNDTQQWPSVYDPNRQTIKFRGYWLRLDTWPEYTGSKNQNTTITTTLPATETKWDLTYLGYWYHKVTLAVRDGLTPDSKELGRVDIYPNSTVGTNPDHVSIPIPKNETGQSRQLHLWFSPTGKEIDMRPCISTMDKWNWLNTWYIYPITQEG